MIWRLAGAAVSGAILGWLGARVPLLGWWTLLPWGAAGALIGFAFPRRAMLVGAAYGFALSFTFMVGVYTGAAPVRTRVPGFALLGGAGAIAGACVALVGAALAARRSKQSASRADAA